MKIHGKIKRLRKEHGMSQAKLAELTGVHKAHFSRRERGVYQPSIDLLKKVAQALNVTADYLLNDEADEITPVKVEDKSLLEKVKLSDTLDPDEKGALIKIIDALLTKKKVIDLVMKEAGFANLIPKAT